ncbi:hypothetical protein C8J57DRAFT_1719431 [Mycena rebaudengoi]|nr:hypothetical protein C8J57DRAFT_1719431 [Mycena rebaudengoi]
MAPLAKSASLRASLARTRYNLDGLKVLLAFLALYSYMQAAAFLDFFGVLRPRARLYRDYAAAGPIHGLLHATRRLRHLLPPHTPLSRCSPTPSPPLPSVPHRPTHARCADAGILRLPCYQPERVALAVPEEACEHWLEPGTIEGARTFSLWCRRTMRTCCVLPPPLPWTPRQPRACDLLEHPHVHAHAHPYPLPPAHLSPADVLYAAVHVGALSASIHWEKGPDAAIARYGDMEDGNARCGSPLRGRAA